MSKQPGFICDTCESQAVQVADELRAALLVAERERDAARARVAELEADKRALMDVIGETQADLDDALRENKRLRGIIAASLRWECADECKAEVERKEGER